MCLALPYRIVALLAPGRARAEGPDGARELDTSLLDPLRPGAYVLVAYGSAIREIDPRDAAELLEVWRELQA